MTRLPIKPRLEWKVVRGKLVPRHRKDRTEGSKRRERVITLDWQNDLQKLDQFFWLCQCGLREGQKPKAPEHNWQALVIACRKDVRVQRYLADGTKISCRRTMDAIPEKNAGKAAPENTRQHVRAIHGKLSDTPRKADHLLQVIRLLWDFAKDKLDRPLGDNPAAKIDLYGTTRQFERWPNWMIDALPSAPADVQAAAELILGTGQRPGAAIAMRHDDFDGDEMWVEGE